MVDPEPVTATGVIRNLNIAANGGGGDGKLSATVVGSSKIVPNQEAPRSDHPTAAGDTVAPPATEQAAATDNAAAADPNELKPNVPAEDTAALPPLQQSNQLENAGGTPAARLHRAQRRKRRWRTFLQAREKEEGDQQAEPVLGKVCEANLSRLRPVARVKKVPAAGGQELSRPSGTFCRC